MGSRQTQLSHLRDEINEKQRLIDELTESVWLKLIPVIGLAKRILYSNIINIRGIISVKLLSSLLRPQEGASSKILLMHAYSKQ